MIFARQSTAIIVTVGPVLDAVGVAVTDGVVGDFKISKNGAAPAALNGSATLTHRNTGFYSLSLTATDVNTVGTVEAVIDDTVNTCPMKEITVLEEAVYDALFAASAPGYGTAQTGDSFARLGAPAGASVSADIAVIEAQTDDIGAAGAGLTAITGKTDNLPTDPADESLIIAATDAIMTRLGVPAGASVSADVAAVKVDTAAILIDTGTTLDAAVAAVKADTAAILVDTGTTLDAALAVVDANVDAILADTGTDGVVVAAGSKSGYALSAAGVTAVWAEVIEGAVTAVQMIRGFAAVLLGKASGLAGTTAVYRDVGDTKDRVTATVDADGNRTAVVRDLT